MKTCAWVIVAAIIIGLCAQSATAVTCSAGNYIDLSVCVSSASDGDVIEVTADVSVTSVLIVNKDLTFTSDPTASTRYTLDGGSSVFMMSIESPNVSILNLALQKGSPCISILAVSYVNSGYFLNLTGSIVTECENTGGGGISYLSNSGSRSLTIVGGAISNNVAYSNGGAIYLSPTKVDGSYEPLNLTLVGTEVSGNEGFGIMACTSYTGSRCSVFVTAGSTITSNTDGGVSGTDIVVVSSSSVTDNGGDGVSSDGGSVSLSDATITGNSGGGIYGTDILVSSSSVTDNGGDGVSSDGGSVSLSSSSVTGNGGDGVSSVGGSVSLSSSSVTGNGGVGITGINYDSVSLSDATITGNTGGGIGTYSISSTGHVIRDNGDYDVDGLFASPCGSMEQVDGLSDKAVSKRTGTTGGVPQVFTGEACVPCSEGSSLDSAAGYSESGQWYCIQFDRAGHVELWIAWLSLFGILAVLAQVGILRTVGIGRVAVSVFFAQLDYAGDTYYVMSADFASTELLYAAVAFYFFPMFIFAFVQRRFVLQHVRSVHAKATVGFPLLWKPLAASFNVVNGPRVKKFTFSSYDEFFKVMAYLTGFVVFAPGYALWATLLSPLWAVALLLYAVHVLAYLFVLFLCTNCKLIGIKEIALLFVEFGGVAQQEEGIIDEESGGGAVLLELNALLNWLFFVELVFESLPQLIIATLNEVAVSKAVGNNDLAISFYLQAGSSVLFFLNELWPLLNSVYVQGSVVEGIKAREQFKQQDNDYASEIGIRAAMVETVAGLVAPIPTLELTIVDKKKASKKPATATATAKTQGKIAPSSTNEGVEKDIAGLKKDNADLKKDNADLKMDIADLKKDNADIKKDNADIKKDNADIKKHNADFKRSIRDVNKKLAGLMEGSV